MLPQNGHTNPIREYNDNKRTGDSRIFCSPNSDLRLFARKTVQNITANITLRRVIFVTVKRGEIYYADLSPVVGSEQGGVRPVLVIQNDVGNKYSPTIIVAAITSKLSKAKIPTHVELSSLDYGLPKDSVVLLEQLRTLDKRRLKEKIGVVDSYKMRVIDNALLISLGFI